MEKELIDTGHAWEKDFPFTGGGRAPWTQVAAVRGGRLIFVAGQNAFDDLGRIIASGRMDLQTQKTYENIVTALKCAGAKLGDIVCERVYVTDIEDYRRWGGPIRARFFAEAGVTKLPPMTLLGVNRLAHRDHLIEVEVTAVTE